MMIARTTLLAVLVSLFFAAVLPARAAEYQRDVQPLLQKYCFPCHSGDDAHGDVNFAGMNSTDDVASEFEVWESAVQHLTARTMPPPDERQPTDDERQRIVAWYRHFINSIEAQPVVLQPRRLSVIEYRNTLRSVFGFDLEVAIVEAEQTVAERSLVVKLLPTDPPGKSGFKNDTHSNPLTTVVWDQYNYLVDVAVEQLFSDSQRTQLDSLIGEIKSGEIENDQLTAEQSRTLLSEIVSRARRRPVPSDQLAEILARLDGLQGQGFQGD